MRAFTRKVLSSSPANTVALFQSFWLHLRPKTWPVTFGLWSFSIFIQSLFQTLTKLSPSLIRTGLSGWWAACNPYQRGMGVGRKAPASCHHPLWPVCLSALPWHKHKDKQENDCFAWWCLVSMVLAAFSVAKWLVAWSGLGSLITTCMAFPLPRNPLWLYSQKSYSPCKTISPPLSLWSLSLEADTHI